MMETFIVLGLCFILYEALDFFQGCMHSTQPATSDRIESYRRQITEEKIRALQPTSPTSSLSASPILGSVGGNSVNDNADITLKSPNSTRFGRFPEYSIEQRYEINNFHHHHQRHQQLHDQQPRRQIHQNHSVLSSSASLPHQAPHHPATAAAAVLLPASNNTTNFSSLPRDYYYLQQQKHKKNTTAKFLTKFSSSLSDNRIFPELGSVLGTTGSAATFDIVPPTAAAAPLVLDLKRAIFTGKKSSSLNEPRSGARLNFNESNEEYLSSSDDDEDDEGEGDDNADDDNDVDGGHYSCSSDNDEHVKRIYSISEKF